MQANVYTLALVAVAVSPVVVAISLVEAGLEWPSDFINLVLQDRDTWAKLQDHLHNANSLLTVAALVLLNSLLCVFGYLLEKIVFGKLREPELKKTLEYSINFLLLKVIVIWAAAELPDQVNLWDWLMWFVMTGWISAFTVMCRTRLEYSLTSVHTVGMPQLRVLTLLGLLMSWNFFAMLHAITSNLGQQRSAGFILFYCFDNFVISIATTRAFIGYLAQWKELSKPDPTGRTATIAYYIDLISDVCAMVVLLFHYCHIVLVHGSLFTIVTFILMTKIRSVFKQLTSRVSRHMAYLRIKRQMDRIVPDASPGELEALHDPCAICQDTLSKQASKLTCGHYFHKTCLMKWLHQHPSCPICRKKIEGLDTDAVGALGSRDSATDVMSQLRLLPNVSFQVHLNGGRRRHPRHVVRGPAQMETLVDQMQEIFPSLHRHAAEGVLRQVPTLEAAVDWVLQHPELLRAPPATVEDQAADDNLAAAPAQPTVA